jgi:hypothetical protein
MDVLRRSSRISIKERIKNVTTRQQIGLEENQLTWYGHVQRMGKVKLPKIALKWMPETKESTRKIEEKLDGRYKEGHERKKPKGRPVGR